jgi:hypothetical protein
MVGIVKKPVSFIKLIAETSRVKRTVVDQIADSKSEDGEL